MRTPGWSAASADKAWPLPSFPPAHTCSPHAPVQASGIEVLQPASDPGTCACLREAACGRPRALTRNLQHASPPHVCGTSAHLPTLAQHTTQHLLCAKSRGPLCGPCNASPQAQSVCVLMCPVLQAQQARRTMVLGGLYTERRCALGAVWGREAQRALQHLGSSNVPPEGAMSGAEKGARCCLQSGSSAWDPNCIAADSVMGVVGECSSCC
mmetsp:Transcript_12834/g.35006  ORF Transcript_12834/g.35006 Transcript_12834/m.35006 type:complete len:211 (-) Transcript_12834:1602-2234(-)